MSQIQGSVEIDGASSNLTWPAIKDRYVRQLERTVRYRAKVVMLRSDLLRERQICTEKLRFLTMSQGEFMSRIDGSTSSPSSSSTRADDLQQQVLGDHHAFKDQATKVLKLEMSLGDKEATLQRREVALAARSTVHSLRLRNVSGDASAASISSSSSSSESGASTQNATTDRPSVLATYHDTLGNAQNMYERVYDLIMYHEEDKEDRKIEVAQGRPHSISDSEFEQTFKHALSQAEEDLKMAAVIAEGAKQACVSGGVDPESGRKPRSDPSNTIGSRSEPGNSLNRIASVPLGLRSAQRGSVLPMHAQHLSRSLNDRYPPPHAAAEPNIGMPATSQHRIVAGSQREVMNEIVSRALDGHDKTPSSTAPTGVQYEARPEENDLPRLKPVDSHVSDWLQNIEG